MKKILLLVTLILGVAFAYDVDAVRLSKLPTYPMIRVTGVCETVDTTDETVWDLGGDYTYFTSATGLDIYSLSASDNAGAEVTIEASSSSASDNETYSEGAIAITFAGLDIYGNAISERITLNGVTTVNTTETFATVNTYTMEFGTRSEASGNILIEDADDANLDTFAEEGVTTDAIALDVSVLNTVKTGAQIVTVYGLDSTYKRISEEIALSGTTTVNLANDYLRVLSAEVTQVGTAGVASLDIAVLQENTTTTKSIILQANGKSMSGMYTIPLDYTGYITGYTISAGASEQDVEVNILVNDYDSDDTIWKVRDVVYTTDNGFVAKQLPFPIVVSEKGDIEITAGAGSTTKVSVELFIILELD